MYRKEMIVCVRKLSPYRRGSAHAYKGTISTLLIQKPKKVIIYVNLTRLFLDISTTLRDVLLFTKLSDCEDGFVWAQLTLNTIFDCAFH